MPSFVTRLFGRQRSSEETAGKGATPLKHLTEEERIQRAARIGQELAKAHAKRREFDAKAQVYRDLAIMQRDENKNMEAAKSAARIVARNKQNSAMVMRFVENLEKLESDINMSEVSSSTAAVLRTVIETLKEQGENLASVADLDKTLDEYSKLMERMEEQNEQLNEAVGAGPGAGAPMSNKQLMALLEETSLAGEPAPPKANPAPTPAPKPKPQKTSKKTTSARTLLLDDD
jgi:ABC-type transporter Mla subunit MlaD